MTVEGKRFTFAFGKGRWINSKIYRVRMITFDHLHAEQELLKVKKLPTSKGRSDTEMEILDEV